MRHKIEAGRDIEVATPGEVQAAVDTSVEHALNYLAAGPHYVNVPASPTTLDAGSGAPLQLGTDPVGPARGRTWSIRRISVLGGPVRLHLSDGQPSTYLATLGGTRHPDFAEFGPGALVVKSGSFIYLVNPTGERVHAAVNIGVADAYSHSEWRL